MKFENKRGKIGREKESLSQLTDSFIAGGSAKRGIIILAVFLALLCLSTTAFGVGSISGRVLKHSDDSPLQGVWVQLLRGVDENIADQHAWIWVDNVQTDGIGYYQFTNLEQRRYRIQVNNQNVGGTHYVDTDLYNVQVLDGADTGDMDLKLRQAGLIWGFVKTTGGTPIENAWVVSDATWGENFFGWHNTRTDSDGRYELWLFPSPGKFYPVWIRSAIIPGTTYKVYGGDTYIDDYEDRFHPELHGYELLGTETATATFNGSYSNYLIVTQDAYLAKVDAVQGSDGSYYGINDGGNIQGWGNVWGAPDEQFASVGYGWGYQGGYILIQPPFPQSNTSLKVYIVPDSRGDHPVSYESKWQDGYLFKATVSGTRVDYTLELGGMAKGRVLNESGDPIRDVRVEGAWNKYGDFGDETFTQSDGYFRLGGLTVGNDNYVALCNDWLEIMQDNVKYMVGEVYRGPINITAGQTATVDTFTIYEAGMVKGLVTDERGAGFPVVGADVRVEGKDIDGNWAEREDVVTDAFGQFTLDYVAPGKYVFYCEKTGFITTTIPGIIVNSAQEVDLDVVLNSQAKGATISGKITNYADVAPKDPDGVYFPCYEDSDYEDYGFHEFGLIAISMDKTYTDEDFLDIDQFFVGDVEEEDIDDGYGDYFEDDATETPGNYTMALPPGDVTIGMYIYNPGNLPGWGGSVNLHDWQRYIFTEGDSQTVDFTAGTGNTGTLKGDLIVPFGYDYFPEDWCMIYAYALEDTTAGPLGDAVAFAGWTTQYKFVNMPVGDYQLRVFARNLPSVVVQSVTVYSGLTTTQDIDLASMPSGTLSGQITFGVTPVEGAMVTIVENGRQAITENDGSYTISAINTGTYTVIVTALGYADAQQDNVNIGTGSNTLDFSLNSQVGSISGTVKDAGNNNVNGATVVAYNESDNTHKTAQTVGGAFTIAGLTYGDYILAVDAGVYGVVVYPEGSGRITLDQNNDDITGIPIAVGTPEPPLFTVTSSVSHNGGTVLSLEFYSDQELDAVPAVSIVEGDGTLGSTTPNIAMNRFNVDYTAHPDDDVVKIQIEETTPIIPNNPASKIFTFEVTADLVTTSSTNVTNATGGTASIMGTQDNTNIYVPPFAIAGAGDDTQALALTIERYGDPGQTVPGTTGSTASAIYDFEFDEEGVTIDINHTFTVTMSFQLPAGMSEAEFENTLELRYFDAGDQEWKTDGITNKRINWLNYTIMFEVSHLSKFAVFVEGACCHPADSITACDNVISILEILAYIDKWAVGDVTILEVLEGIDLWAAGQYYCDENGNYKPGIKP